MCFAVAVLRGAWVGHGPTQTFSWPPAWPPSFVLNFTFKFVWLTYTADNFQPANFQRFEDFLARVLTIFTSLYLHYNGKSPSRGDIYVGFPTYFLGPAVPPPSFFILESPLLLRLTMSQERLSDLSILCVWRMINCDFIDFDDTIDEFAARKARRKMFWR